MKKISTSLNAHITRAAITAIFFIVSLCLLAISTINAGSQNKAQVTGQKLSQPNLTSQPFMGTFDPHSFPCATPRHHFTVPLDGVNNQVRIIVQVDATVPANDLNVTLLYGAGPNPVMVAQTD